MPAVYEDDAAQDQPNGTLHMTNKREIFMLTWEFETYVKYANLRSVAILENFAKNGPANIINTGGFPTHKRVTVILHSELKATFPGVESFLPPCTSGASYPDDFQWAVWMQAPVSKTYKDGHYGAFAPVAKSFILWQENVEEHNGRSDPSAPPVPMWTPPVLLKALDR